MKTKCKYCGFETPATGRDICGVCSYLKDSKLNTNSSNLIVYYRITSVPSTNPSPIYQNDKDKLNELCLKSFINAFKEIKPKTIFICDFCSLKTIDMIDEIYPFEKEIITTRIGQNETSLLQYRMAKEQDLDIYFAESDYIYLENSGIEFLKGLEEFDLVSPYDHPDHYKTSFIPKLKVINNHHWRSAENNTMTWAVKNKLFKDHYDIFYKYGYLDREVWDDLREQGHELWVPIPSLATHSVASYLAPTINWEEKWSL